MTEAEFLARFTSSPELFIHQIDVIGERALVVALSPAEYRSATFLDERALTPTTFGRWLPLENVERATGALSHPLPLHFIWHTGHVGSTLLSRLLDDVAGVLSLREPPPLRTLADAHDTVQTPYALVGPVRLERLATALCASWARGHEGTRSVVVKAMSVASRIGPFLGRLLPDARSIHMNVGLEPYLATSLSRGGSPLDLRAYGPERMRRLLSRVDCGPPALWEMSTGELAAMTWVTETLTVEDLRVALGDRLLCVDFEAFLGDVEEGASHVLEHLGLGPEPGFADRIRQSTVLHRHSKALASPFSPALRREVLETARARHGDEIRKGLAWVDGLALRAPSVAALLRKA